MAIGTDAAIEFFGTQDTVTAGGGTSAVSNDAFSVGADAAAWTNDDDAVMATMVAMLDWATAPNANSYVNLYARLMNIDGTNDQDVPDANYPHVFLGSFPINDVTTNQYIAIEIGLPNTVSSQVYEFYVENKTGQTLQAGWTMKITPKAIGPHA